MNQSAFIGGGSPRLFTDTNTSQDVVVLLEQLAWDVETAYEAKLEKEKDDTKLLIHARENERIYLTFDYLRGKQGCDIAQQLRTNGGQILQIKGGADADKYRILGKILFHYPDWYSFLNDNHGISIISDIYHNCKNFLPEEFHHAFHKLDAQQFDEYLKKRALVLQLPPRKRQRKTSATDQDQELLT